MAPAGIVPAASHEGKLRPYPWGALTSLSRDQARLTASLSALARGMFGPEKVTRTVSELLGAPARFAVRQVGSARNIEPLVGSVALLIEEVDAPAWRALVEVERGLALAAVTRSLGRPPPRLVSEATPLPDAVCGAFAAVVSAVLRRAEAAGPLRVLGAGAGQAVWAEATRYDEDLVVAELTAWIDDDAFLLRVALPRDFVAATPPPPMHREALARLGDVPLVMPVVACASLANAEDVAGLRVGDAWMPGSFRLARTGALGVSGRVALAAPTSDVGLAAEIGADGKVVILGDSEDLSMSEAVAEQNAGELPVIVRVEIGSVELRAREWAGLASGDVVALGQRVGAPVVLRVGGLDVARGELVEIDGEVGVRIVSRSDAR